MGLLVNQMGFGVENPGALRTFIRLSLCIYWDLTEGFNGLQIAILFTVSERQGLSIQALRDAISDEFLDIPYADVRRATRALNDSRLIASSRLSTGRGRPYTISITKQGVELLDRVLDRTQTIIDTIPTDLHSMIEEIAFEVLNQRYNSDI